MPPKLLLTIRYKVVLDSNRELNKGLGLITQGIYSPRSMWLL